MSLASAPAIVRLPVWRARFVLFAFVAAFGVLFARAVVLQALETEFLQEKGDARYSRLLEVPATRGRVLDRHGDALAISTPVKSVWAIPEDLRASPAQRKQLAALLELAPADLDQKLARNTQDFVYLRRQIAPETASRVAELGIAGLYQQREYRRYYPGGETTAHVVGFTGVEDAGQEGVELAFQSSLAGTSGSRRVIKDRLGRIIEDVESVRSAHDGRDLQLALDGKIQALAFAVLKSAVEYDGDRSILAQAFTGDRHHPSGLRVLELAPGPRPVRRTALQRAAHADVAAIMMPYGGDRVLPPIQSARWRATSLRTASLQSHSAIPQPASSPRRWSWIRPASRV